MRVLAGFLCGVLVTVGWQYVTVSGQAAPQYARFAGGWYRHGGYVSISPNGSGTFSFRTYINCTPQVQTACDRFIGNSIYDGGYLQFRLRKAVGNVATGAIVGSAFSWQVNTKVHITLHSNDTILLQAPGMSLRACGPHAPSLACGA